jgi:hypothetical protein
VITVIAGWTTPTVLYQYPIQHAMEACKANGLARGREYCWGSGVFKGIVEEGLSGRISIVYLCALAPMYANI